MVIFWRQRGTGISKTSEGVRAVTVVLDQALPFGIRDTHVTPYTDAANTTLGATSTDVPNARDMSFSEAEDFEELRGDDKSIAYRGKGAHVEWSMEHGGISLAAYKAMAGGTITTSGTTPDTVTTFSKKVTDARPYFQAEGQSINDNGGDWHVVLYKCRVTGNLTGDQADGSFWLTGADGVALPANLTGKEDALYDFVFNETAVDIT
jgi:hypothetical protein